jgi:regulatory protein
VSPRIRGWPDDPEGTGREHRLPTAARLYTEGVRALARRELTAQQLREKLLAAGGRALDVDQVLARLADEGALDDRRAARAYAHRAFRQRKRARGRIREELERLGVAPDIARETVDEVCAADVERRRLDLAVVHALRRTHREERTILARRLIASLTRQGFDLDDVTRALARAGIDASELDDV